MCEKVCEGEGVCVRAREGLCMCVSSVCERMCVCVCVCVWERERERERERDGKMRVHIVCECRLLVDVDAVQSVWNYLN